MASRICHFAAAAGLRVPEQVAVLGMGNNPLICGCATVPLSSVDSNQYEEGGPRPKCSISSWTAG